MLLHCHGPWLPAKISLATEIFPTATVLLLARLGYKKGQRPRRCGSTQPSPS
jgi:hypothetical protein